jgi:phage host-nuclease inhibitor protein Gam
MSISLSELERIMLMAEAEELNISDIESEDGILIRNNSDADFYIKLINRFRREIDEINEFVDAELERQVRLYESYREERLRPIENQIRFYEEALRTYTMNELADSNRKSIKLPNGTLAIRKQQPSYNYNEEEVMQFLKENELEQYITTKTTESLNKKDIKKDFIVNNNNQLVYNNKIVPGASVEFKDDKFEVK